jgi:hypothetical protein
MAADESKKKSSDGSLESGSGREMATLSREFELVSRSWDQNE